MFWYYPSKGTLEKIMPELRLKVNKFEKSATKNRSFHTVVVLGYPGPSNREKKKKKT